MQEQITIGKRRKQFERIYLPKTYQIKNVKIIFLERLYSEESNRDCLKE